MNLPIQPLDESEVPAQAREWLRQSVIDPANTNFASVQRVVAALPTTETLTLTIEKGQAAPYLVDTSASRAPLEVRVKRVRNLENAEDTATVTSAPYALWTFSGAVDARSSSKIKIVSLLGGFSAAKKYEVMLEVTLR